MRASALKQLNAPGIKGGLERQNQEQGVDMQKEVESDSDVEFVMEEKPEGNWSVELHIVLCQND